MNLFETQDYRRFFEAYIDCALWSSEIEGETLDGDSLVVLEAHARSYYSRVHYYAEVDEQATPYGGDHYAQLGHDFWLDQNGHGAGARDGRWPVYGDIFHKVAKAYPEITLILNDDGVVCL